MHYLSNDELYDELNEMYTDCVGEVQWEKDRADDFRALVEEFDKYDIEMLIKYLNGEKVDAWWNVGALICKAYDFSGLSKYEGTSKFIKVSILEEVLKNRS